MSELLERLDHHVAYLEALESPLVRAALRMGARIVSVHDPDVHRQPVHDHDGDDEDDDVGLGDEQNAADTLPVQQQHVSGRSRRPADRRIDG